MASGTVTCRLRLHRNLDRHMHWFICNCSLYTCHSMWYLRMWFGYIANSSQPTGFNSSVQTTLVASSSPHQLPSLLLTQCRTFNTLQFSSEDRSGLLGSSCSTRISLQSTLCFAYKPSCRRVLLLGVSQYRNEYSFSETTYSSCLSWFRA